MFFVTSCFQRIFVECKCLIVYSWQCLFTVHILWLVRIECRHLNSFTWINWAGVCLYFLSLEATVHTQTVFTGLNLHCLPFCHTARIRRLVRSATTVCVCVWERECVEICNTADSASEHPSFHDRLWQRISIVLCVTLCCWLFSPAEGSLNIWFHINGQKWVGLLVMTESDPYLLHIL